MHAKVHASIDQSVFETLRPHTYMDITLSLFVCQRASSYLMNKSLSFAISVFVLYLAGKANMLDDTGSKLKVHAHVIC